MLEMSVGRMLLYATHVFIDENRRATTGLYVYEYGCKDQMMAINRSADTQDVCVENLKWEKTTGVQNLQELSHY